MKYPVMNKAARQQMSRIKNVIIKNAICGVGLYR